MAAAIHGIGRGGVLNDAKVKAAKPREKPYKLSDSGQLFLHVTPAGGRHWRMHYTFGRNEAGRPVQKTLSFGAYPGVTLGEARQQRDQAKGLLAQGRDPAVARKAARRAEATSAAATFEVVARRWHGLRLPTWSTVHAADVLRSLERDVFPTIGAEPIADLTTPTILDVVEAIQKRGAIETGQRVRQRISDVFLYAIGAGLATANPAAGLHRALTRKPRAKPQPSIIDRVRGVDEQLAAVKALLKACDDQRCRATTKLALRLLALTAVRPNEIHGARWSELEGLDGAEPVWRIPAARMKGDADRKAEEGGDHLVPLSRQAVAIIETLRPLTGDLPLLFPSDRHLHKPMSENTLRALLIRAGYHQRHVPHGFRAAFSTIMNERADRAWREAGHQGGSPDRPIIDLMLAHVPKDRVEGAYNRAGYMPRRRELAQDWADLVTAELVPPEAHLGQPIRYAATGPGRGDIDRAA